MTSTKKKTIFTAAVLLVLLAACLIVDMTLPSYHIVVTVIKKATVYSLVAVSMNLLNGFTGRSVDVQLYLGTLHIEYNEQDGNVYMTGPAAQYFTGQLEC